MSGTVTIVELLDAQAAALRASENASNAIFDFLIDFMEVERSISMFSFFQTRAERDDFYRQVHEYLTARGVQALPEDQVTRSLRR